MIELHNTKLHDYIVTKDELVTEGRGLTAQIEQKERRIKYYEEKEKEITGKVQPDGELKETGDKLVAQINELTGQLEKLAKTIEKKKLAAIPDKMLEEHKALLKEKEQLERERNKLALKIQKIKDRIIPIIKKEVKPLLGEYDDIETAKAKNGKVVVTTFNHLEDWKAKRNK